MPTYGSRSNVASSVQPAIWLAAQAVERKFALLTGNAKDFKDVPGLKFVTVSAHRSGA